jgi:hypothetical protein
MDADPAWEVQGIRKPSALQDLEGAKVSWKELRAPETRDSVIRHVLGTDQYIFAFFELKVVLASPLVCLFLLQILGFGHGITHLRDKTHAS